MCVCDDGGTLTTITHVKGRARSIHCAVTAQRRIAGIVHMSLMMYPKLFRCVPDDPRAVNVSRVHVTYRLPGQAC